MLGKKLNNKNTSIERMYIFMDPQNYIKPKWEIWFTTQLHW